MEYAPIGFTLGSPPKFNQPYAGLNVPGSYARFRPGIPIDRSCGEVTDAVQALSIGDVPPFPIMEVLVTLSSTEEGTHVAGYDLDYEQDGVDHTLTVDWQMVVCDEQGELPQCDR
jgi:hypothetical protein